MLRKLFSGSERLLSLGTSGPWWWRYVGGGISLAILVAIFLLVSRR